MLIADEHKITKYDVIIVFNTIILHYIHFSAAKIESSKSVAVSKRPDYTRLLQVWELAVRIINCTAAAAMERVQCVLQ